MFARLFKRNSPPIASPAADAEPVSAFMRAVKMATDERDLMIPKRHILIYTYAYGALSASRPEDARDETALLASLYWVLKHISGMDERDISAMLGHCAQNLHDEEGRGFAAMGRRDFQAWQSGEREAARRLGEYLRSH